MRGRTFLAHDVLRQARQAHPSRASRGGELRLDRRLVHGRADAISRHRRRPARQLVLHREFLADAARRSRAAISAPTRRPKPLLHLWSLSIEEQFYLVWSVLLLALFKLERRLVPVVILSVFVASFAFSVVLTPIDPIAAFYLPWTRGWELALGALIAYREVFWLEALPYPSRRIANIGAGAGIALMLGAFLFLNETRPFPGWLAAIPTLGCALVIANPGSLPGEVALGNRVAGFFGVDFLSALSVALAAVRLRPHLARRDPDHARPVRACGRRRGARRAHLSADRAADRDSVSPPAVRDRVGPRGPARADRNRRTGDLRFEGFSRPASRRSWIAFSTTRPTAPRASRSCAASISATRRAIRSRRSASARRASSRIIIARRSPTR